MTYDPNRRQVRGSARVPDPRLSHDPSGYGQRQGAEQRSGTAYGRGGKRPGARPGRVRPKWGRIALVVGLALSVLATFAGIGAWAYVNGLNDDMDRVDAFTELTGERAPDTVDGDLNILVVGSDSRNPDSDEGSRTDTIMLMHIPSSHDKAYIVSLPRDLYVPIPQDANGNGGYDDKINAAFALGGAPLLIQTVEGYTNVHIDHFVEIDFTGLESVVDALGGVTMNVEETIESIHKPYRTFEKGVNEMNGAEALDYVRQRYQFSDGDFARMRHQQQLIKAIMDKATSAGVLTDATKLNAFMQTVTQAVVVDETFSLLDVAIQFRDLRSEDLVFMTSPNLGSDTIDGSSVVVPDDENAGALYQAMSNDETAAWVANNPDFIKSDKN